jgi:uncharacterized membrane protein
LTLESSKTLGGIGAILMFIGIFPPISYYGIIEFVGAVLILVALHSMSTFYGESRIFSHALYGVIVGIVGAIVAAVVTIYSVLTSITDLVQQIYPGWNGDWSTLQGMTPNTANFDPSNFYSLFEGILAVLIIVWIFAIIASFFVWRSLKQVSTKSNVGMFGTAGLLLFIGAIIPLIGLILMWVAALILAIAFFTMKPQEKTPPPPTI